MATAAQLALVVGVVGTILGGAAVLFVLVRRARRCLAEVADVQRRLQPRLERFRQATDVRGNELDRLGATLQDRATRRAQRRRRRGLGASSPSG